MILSGTKKIIIIFSLGIVVASVFALLSSLTIYPADPIQYDMLGLNLLKGHGFSLDNSAPYRPTLYREPFYPVFLAAIYFFFGHDVNIAILAQIVLHAITALLAYGIGKYIFSEKSAFVTGMVVAVFPTLASTSSYIMSETLFTFLLCLGVFLILKAMKHEQPYLYMVSGLVFGLGTLTKAASIFLPFVIVPVILLNALKKKVGARRLFLCIACLIALYALTVSAWSLRNKKVCDTYSITSRSGVVIWSRAAKVNDSPRQLLVTACYSLSEALAKRLFPDIAAGYTRVLYKDLEKALALEDRYLKEGKPQAEVDEILKEEAFANISRHPVRYLLYTFVEWLKMTAFSYVPLLNEPPIADRFAEIRNGDIILTILKGSIRMLAYPLLVLVFLGIAKNFGIWQRWLPLLVVILYFNIIYSLLDAIGRYAVPLIPIYCIFASAAIFDAGQFGGPGA